jgi:hypothetical protein
MPLSAIHKLLTEKYELHVSQSHVGNLLRFGLALVNSRDIGSEHLRARLREQGGIILSIDAVSFDETSSALYVLRDIPSGEFLLARRLEIQSADAVASLFREVKSLGIPVLGIISDKEAAFGGAAEKVFPNVPHQICQYHYLNNLAKPMESDSASLGRAVRTTTQNVRKLELQILKHRNRAQQDNASGVSTHLSKVSAEERDIVLRFCKVVKTVGKVRGDKLLNPTPLKRYERLHQAARAVEKASKKSDTSWSLLSKLLACFSTLTGFQEEGERLSLRVGTLRQIAHILKLQLPGAEIRARLTSYLDTLKESTSPTDTSPYWAEFVDHVSKVSERFWKGLFHCYSLPELPSTNNETEAFFGTLKRFCRKVTGRRSTSGGPVETCPEFFVEAFTLLRGKSHSEILSMLGDIPDTEVQEAVSRFKELAEPSRQKRSIARDPESELENILEEWSKIPPGQMV